MDERPISFSGPMVRAILAGKKTQTRRVVKPQPSPEYWQPPILTEWYAPAVVRKGRQEPGPLQYGFANEEEGWRCPYGGPGDRLWVREAFDWVAGTSGGKRFNKTLFRADGGKPVTGKWTASLFMPRWASRITLAITDVRVQRVQEISHKDALAEGVEYDVSQARGSPLCRFQHLWDALNAKRGFSWESNPWVWVITFSVVR